MDTTAWDTYHRRASALRQVVARLERDGSLAWDPTVFTDRDDVLVALHDLWTRRLEARVDLALELHDIPGDAVAEAWRQVAGELPAVRRVLDEHAEEPALRAHELHEHRLLAVAAGLATLGDPVAHSAAVGREYVAGARAAVVPRQRDGWLADRMGTFFRRRLATPA